MSAASAPTPGGYEVSGLRSIPPPLGSLGSLAFWIGFILFALATTYMIRAVFHSHSKSSRMFHYITLMTTMVCT